MTQSGRKVKYYGKNEAKHVKIIKICFWEEKQIEILMLWEKLFGFLDNLTRVIWHNLGNLKFTCQFVIFNGFGIELYLYTL